ncbi:MAG TPA: hypothetical protein VLL54_08140 [Pyrinomonadaceae bacterium]|nr:hypothetical protein [Pyrinomonadaceae bacterium]
MKRAFRLALVFAAGLAVVTFLPLYIERTMLRSWRTDQVGDVIEWGWKICSLNTFWADYQYISREQDPTFWLKVNLALAFVYALMIALVVDLILTRRKRKSNAFSRAAK